MTSSATGTSVGLGEGPLLARYAAARDETAFVALVARHGPMVLATCRAVLRQEHDVDDAFQATFLVLAMKARSVRAGDALGGWLHLPAGASEGLKYLGDLFHDLIVKPGEVNDLGDIKLVPPRKDGSGTGRQ